MQTELASEEQIAPPTSKRVGGIRVTRARSAVLLFVGTAACCACGVYGALTTAYGHLPGQAIIVDSTTRSFGVVDEGDSASVRFRLSNRGSQPLRIVGCMSYCDCVVPADLPFTLRPGESREFEVSLRTIPGQARWKPVIDQPVTLYTTNPDQAEMHLTVKGEVRAPAHEGSSGS